MDNIQEAINWFDAEIKAQESGYAFALASGKERDEHFENWLDIMRAALVALRNEHGRVRGCEYCNTEHNKFLTDDVFMATTNSYGDKNRVITSRDGLQYKTIHYCPMCGRRLEVEP
jgi:hypothetical protein